MFGLTGSPTFLPTNLVCPQNTWFTVAVSFRQTETNVVVIRAELASYKKESLGGFTFNNWENPFTVTVSGTLLSNIGTSLKFGSGFQSITMNGIEVIVSDESSKDLDKAYAISKSSW